MTFVRNRPSSLWLPDTVIDPGELELWDQQISDAIDGAGGGAYAPSAPIEIGGSGLTVSGDFESTGSFAAQATATFGGIPMTRYRDRIPGLRTNYEYLLPLINTRGTGSWAIPGSASPWTAGNDAAVFRLPIGPLPLTFTGLEIYLSEVSVILCGNGGHSALPATMPTLKVYVVHQGGFTQLGSTITDNSPNVLAYQAEHYLSANFWHEIGMVSPGGEIFAEITSEAGTNSVSGLKLLAASATVSVPPP